MNIIFRVDASTEIGSGHVMRCLVLADQLKTAGANIAFVSRELKGHLCALIENKNFRVYRLPYYDQSISWEVDWGETKRILDVYEEPIHWIVIDHYNLDCQWEEKVRKFAKKTLVIDDLANRCHDCDLLLDQNLYYNLNTRYDTLVPRGCHKLLGPQYALLKPDFYRLGVLNKQRTGHISRILVSLGGCDSTNQTEKVLQAISIINQNDIHIDVVIGKTNPHKKKLQNIYNNKNNICCYVQINHMADFMYRADFMIGAGGVTTWERGILGLPSITIITADNQIEQINAVSELNATWSLGHYNAVTIEQIVFFLQQALDHPTKVREMGVNARKMMEGSLQKKGYLSRVMLGE